ncbi:MAG: EAL domain-containing protein [Agitococcus sp.]
MPQKKVLLIDDDKVICEIALQLLSEEGFTVITAQTAALGLQAAVEHKPDLVLLDVVLPDLNGYTVCQQIRASTPHLPIIMLTGLDDNESIVQAYECGATDFFAKPIKWKLLGYRIHYILRASRTLEQLTHSETALANAQRLAHLGSWEWYPQEDRTERSDEYYRIYGADKKKLASSMFAILPQVHAEDQARVKKALEQAQKQAQSYQQEFRISAPHNGMRVLHEQARVFIKPTGEIDYIEGITQDITELVDAQKRIRSLAYYDNLTGLANRQLFRELLQHELQRALRQSTQCALLFIDLDRFKRINDTLGQPAGDLVLQTIGNRINSCIRGCDIAALHYEEDQKSEQVARLGSDEFTVILTDIEQPEDAAQIVRRILDVIAQPIEGLGQEVLVSASIGIALGPQDGSDVETLIKNADLAMYAAKDRGRNTYQFFDKTMNDVVLDKFALENDLRKAIEQDQLELYFQPKINPMTGVIVGAEVLLRWKHPQRGMVSPLTFIPIAEESGFIIELGTWVLQQACQINHDWQAKGMPIVPLAINLSAANFNHPNLLPDIKRTLTELSLSPNSLVIELTEGILMTDVQETVETLKALKEMGIYLSVDDFGTGYSSLSYLKRFPLDELKIDKGFVQDIINDPNDAAITAAIIGLAQNLKLNVVAEGVETTEQADFLLRRGCNTMQGYLFAKPMPRRDFEKLLLSGLDMRDMQAVFMVDY